MIASNTSLDAAQIRVRPKIGLWIGLAILAVIAFLALAGPWLLQSDPMAQNIMNRRIPPIWDAWFNPASKASVEHLLGTDRLGRDYLARVIAGARISLPIGFITAGVAVTIGAAIGIAAGYWRGRVDAALSFVIQTRLSLPIMLVALTSISLLGGSLSVIIITGSLLLWDRAAIVSRTMTMQLSERDYVRVAKVLGATNWQIIRREILPGLRNALLIIFTIELGNAILLEASLSFLGLGLPPPAPSWGLMLAEAREDIFSAPWMIAVPGVALLLTVFATGLIGDALQTGEQTQP